MIGSPKVHWTINSVFPPLLLVFLTMGCSGGDTHPRSNILLEGLESPDEEVVEGCKRARVKCVSCHEVDRILHSNMSSPAGWSKYVSRMRRMPGGGISAADAPLIVRCLVYRDFGNKGLAELKGSSN